MPDPNGRAAALARPRDPIPNSVTQVAALALAVLYLALVPAHLLVLLGLPGRSWLLLPA